MRCDAVKIIFVSDIHAAVKLPHARVAGDATMSDRLEQTAGVLFKQLVQHCKIEAVKHVFILGDLFDSRHPDMPTLSYVGSHLKLLGEVATVHILPGNHDAHDRSGQLYTLDLFDVLEVDGIDVILNPKRIELPGADGVVFHAFPWIPDSQIGAVIRETKLETGPAHIALLHQTIDGCTDGNRGISSPFKVSELADFDLAMSGHIHKPQEIGDNVQYLGSPYAIRFNDADDLERGFWVLETDTLELTMVPVTKAPKFLKFHISGFCVAGDFEDFREEIEAAARSAPVYVSFAVEGGRAFVDDVVVQLGQLSDTLKLQSRLVVDVKLWRINRIVTDDGASERVRAAIVGGAVPTPEMLVEAYTAAQMEPPAPMDVLTKMGLEFLEEA